MITRLWHGYTSPQNADAYHRLLSTTILPAIHRIEGYRGCYLLRKDDATGNQVEFITLTLWDSMDAVREFAGGDRAVILPEAERLLARGDENAVHYETTWVP